MCWRPESDAGTCRTAKNCNPCLNNVTFKPNKWTRSLKATGPDNGSIQTSLIPSWKGRNQRQVSFRFKVSNLGSCFLSESFSTSSRTTEVQTTGGTVWRCLFWLLDPKELFKIQSDQLLASNFNRDHVVNENDTEKVEQELRGEPRATFFSLCHR